MGRTNGDDLGFVWDEAMVVNEVRREGLLAKWNSSVKTPTDDQERVQEQDIIVAVNDSKANLAAALAERTQLRIIFRRPRRPSAESKRAEVDDDESDCMAVSRVTAAACCCCCP